MKDVVRASAYAGFAELVTALGGDVRRIAADAGAPIPEFDRPDEFISSRNLNLLLTAAAEATRHPDLGLRWGEITEPSFLGPLYIAMSNSDTARDAIDLAAAYLYVHSPVAEVFRTPLPDRNADLVGLRCLMVRPPPMVQTFERQILLLHRVFEIICGDQYRPVEVWFEHSRLSPMATYRKFFGIDPDFDRPQNGIIVERSALAAYQPGRNQQLLDMAETYLRQQTPADGSSIAPAVANMIHVMIEAEDCTATQVARMLGLHERTMQRRLQASGATFERIKDGVVRDRAVSLLRDPDVQISCIAWKLHYNSSSAFTRSCQRWFGLAPREMRRKLLAGVEPLPA